MKKSELREIIKEELISEDSLMDTKKILDDIGSNLTKLVNGKISKSRPVFKKQLVKLYAEWLTTLEYIK